MICCFIHKTHSHSNTHTHTPWWIRRAKASEPRDRTTRRFIDLFAKVNHWHGRYMLCIGYRFNCTTKLDQICIVGDS